MKLLIMLRKWIGIGNVLILIFALVTGFNAKSQVDQRWLNSWNEANKNKPSNIMVVGNIAPDDEPGISLVIVGKIYNPDNTPAKDVLVHAYHRDSKGFDFGKNDSELSTWRLQGWAKTDETGCFEFRTIRPAPDHLGREGPHIHFTTVSEKSGRQWARKVFLSDDPTLTDAQRNESKKAGKFGWIATVKTVDDVQYINVNIKLKKKADF